MSKASLRLDLTVRRTSRRHSLAALLLPWLLATGGQAHAQSQTKGRVLVMVDTSGSMVWHFGDCGTTCVRNADCPAGQVCNINGNCTEGDGDASSVFCDNNLGSGFGCGRKSACTVGNGGVARFPIGSAANPSRLYAAKSALNDVLSSAGGDLDFGLERYGVNAACPDTTRNCSITQVDNTTQGRLVQDPDYLPVPNARANLTWAGGCGTSSNCTNCGATEGGQMLVTPGPVSTSAVFPWIDFTEDFCSSSGSTGDWPRNPELRSAGPTPLAGTIRTARKQWYQTIFNASNGGNCNPNSDPNCDPQINCRPYVYVVMTDGGEDCEDPAQWFSDPQKAVAELTAVNATNPVQTYVIAMSFTKDQPCNALCPKNIACKNNVCACRGNADCGLTCDGFQYTCGSDGLCHHPALSSLNAMATAGGTGTARFANNQTDIEAAFADIVASSVKFEKCNGIDDNCNTIVDEGLGVYQECTTSAQCSTGTCNLGRCACAKDSDCKSGYACAASLCVPSCSVGVGACLATGVTKCTSASGTGCCVNDGKAACTPLMAGPPGTEVCNGIDDNCNGIIDEGGVCQKCTPISETCNGKDDDCDGIIDNHLTDVGKGCGLNVGVCKPGTTACVNGAGQDVTKPGVVADTKDNLVCQGGTMAGAQMCNGCDNNCDGVIDRPQQACYSGSAGTNNVGPCHGGLQQCAQSTCGGGAMWGPCIGESLPGKEVCNGVDDDCNGKVDDVTGTGGACCPSGKCGMGVCMAGSLQCSGGAIVCVGASGPSQEICDGLDNDCNGKTDDVAGIGQACQVGGTCGGVLQCDPQKRMLVCSSTGMKSPEICDGIDNDCDGNTDEMADVLKNDPRVGKPCGNNMNLPSPCKAGTTICQNGQVLCQGAVGPMPEVCDGIDNNCDGKADNGASCPMGFDCLNAGCYSPCGSGEFPCPGGYACDPKTNHCLPDNCNCKACEKCVGNSCVDACTGVSCANGFACKCGSCVDDSCVSKGCPSGQKCDQNQRMCVTDPCFMVMCQVNQFCDPATGNCAATCAGVTCPSGQVCKQGNCVGDKCAGVKCPEGQACDSLTGMCGKDPCFGVACTPGFVCVAGSCQQDPCASTQCPTGTLCKTSSDGTVNCVTAPAGKTPPRDEVVGAGGGGFTCDAGGGRPPVGATGSFFAALALVALAFARRRARSLLARAGARS